MAKRPKSPLGIVLGHQDEVALDLRRATEAEEGLAEPVPGLALQLAIIRLMRRGLKGLPRGLELAPLIAGPTALDQLGHHTEDGADRIARECARGRQGRDGAAGRVAHESGGRQVGQSLRGCRHGRRGQRDGRLVERQGRQWQEPAHLGRRQLEGDLGEGGPRGCDTGDEQGHGQDAWDRATSHERPPRAGAADLGPGFGWSGAGLSLAATAERRSFAQLRSVVSGLFAATSS